MTNLNEQLSFAQISPELYLYRATTQGKGLGFDIKPMRCHQLDTPNAN